MTDHGHTAHEGPTLRQIYSDFKISREQSIARHNAQLTHKHVKRKARKSLRHDVSMIGLAVVVVLVILELARAIWPLGW